MTTPKDGNGFPRNPRDGRNTMDHRHTVPWFWYYLQPDGITVVRESGGQCHIPASALRYWAVLDAKARGK